MISKILQVSVIKTVCFNLVYFGIKGLKLPVLISRKTVLKKLRGGVSISNPSFGCVHIGFDAIGIFDYDRDRSIWENYGNICFDTKATLGHGVRISNFGSIYFGKNFRLTANSSFICHKEIRFGDNCLVSWNCKFMDTDFHKIYDEKGNLTNDDDRIVFGDSVWVTSECKILKGSEIADRCVVACNSIISGQKVNKTKCVVGSFGKIIRNSIRWEL